MEPIVNRLAVEYEEEVEVVSLNANTDGEAEFRQLGLRGHPVIVIFDANSTEVYRGLGVQSEETLRDALPITDESG